MSDGRRSLAGLFAICLAASACGNGSQRVLLQNQFSRVPISSIALDDYANDGTLTVAPGTEFGLQLSGDGWTFMTPAADAPFQLISGPADWLPETGFLGPGNCDSASPCGGDAALYKASGLGHGEVRVVDGGGTAFDLHLIVRPGPTTLDVKALPIPAEALGTSVTMPVGSVVRVHFSGNWSAPTPNAEVNELFREMHRSSSGVVRLQGVTHTADGDVYSYAITGKGGCAYDFTDLDGPALGDGYTIGFDVPRE